MVLIELVQGAFQSLARLATPKLSYKSTVGISIVWSANRIFTNLRLKTKMILSSWAVIFLFISYVILGDGVFDEMNNL